jgi:hypothetical protein
MIKKRYLIGLFIGIVIFYLIKDFLRVFKKDMSESKYIFKGYKWPHVIK